MPACILSQTNCGGSSRYVYRRGEAIGLVLIVWSSGVSFEPNLEPSPRRDCLPFLNTEPHSAVVHHLLRCPLASIRSLIDGVLDYSLVLIRP